MRPANAWAGGAFLLLLTATSLVAARSGPYNWDAIGYVAVVESWRSDDPALVHARTYAAIADVPGGRSLVEGDGFRREVAADPGALQNLLPFYRIRPLYNGIHFSLASAGLGAVAATRAISASAYWLLGFGVWWAAGRFLRGWTRAAVASAIVLAPPLVETARLSTPDMLAAGVLASGCLLIAAWDRVGWGALALLAAVLVRTDAALTSIAVGAVVWLRRPARAKAWLGPALVVSSIAAAALVNLFAGSWGWAATIHHTFVRESADPGRLRVAFEDLGYAGLVARGLRDAAGGIAPVVLAGFALLWALARRGTGTLDDAALGLALAASMVAHFVFFPAAWDRFFVAHAVLCAFLLAKALLPRVAAAAGNV